MLNAHTKTNKPPLLTVLNFSGGVQSTAILELVLSGELEVKGDFVVVRADPGMEDRRTYEHVSKMEQRCCEAGIDIRVAPGPNLYEDLLQIGSKRRIDNPAYWVKNAAGKLGQLRQKCTQHYKIRPMDRLIRQILFERFGITRKGRPPLGAVEKWIGFTLDEAHRIKDSRVRYQRFTYPLIDLGYTKLRVHELFAARGWNLPPRSVCIACWANPTEYFLQMKRERPGDYQKAINVDESISEGSASVGVKGAVFVSRSLVRLRALSEANRGTWQPDLFEANSCDSGYCFT